ncbi:MAG: hypothetical protein JEZ06_00645 [Anaerolineaceae bacterium]|nr:hypothetical protein [Anaerolineaceae bacterium]
MQNLVIGRLLRSNTSGCVFGCRVSQISTPQLGELIRISIDQNQDKEWVYGLINDIHIDDDGLIRQLVSTEGISEEVLLDNRENRNMPVEISVLFTGCKLNSEILYLLPPRPPLSLDKVHLCNSEELIEFTNSGHYGYFRHILRDSNLPSGEILAAHLRQAGKAHSSEIGGDPQWIQGAIQELITLMKHDHNSLMSILGAVADAHLSI